MSPVVWCVLSVCPPRVPSTHTLLHLPCYPLVAGAPPDTRCCQTPSSHPPTQSASRWCRCSRTSSRHSARTRCSDLRQSARHGDTRSTPANDIIAGYATLVKWAVCECEVYRVIQDIIPLDATMQITEISDRMDCVNRYIVEKLASIFVKSAQCQDKDVRTTHQHLGRLCCGFQGDLLSFR